MPPCMKSAAMISVRPKTEPADRSISRIAIRNAIPPAMIATYTDSCRTSRIWEAERNSGCRMPITAPSASVANSTLVDSKRSTRRSSATGFAWTARFGSIRSIAGSFACVVSGAWLTPCPDPYCTSYLSFPTRVPSPLPRFCSDRARPSTIRTRYSHKPRSECQVPVAPSPWPACSSTSSSIGPSRRSSPGISSSSAASSSECSTIRRDWAAEALGEQGDVDGAEIRPRAAPTGTLGQPVHDRVAVVGHHDRQQRRAVTSGAPQRLDRVQRGAVAEHRHDGPVLERHREPRRGRDAEAERAVGAADEARAAGARGSAASAPGGSRGSPPSAPRSPAAARAARRTHVRATAARPAPAPADPADGGVARAPVRRAGPGARRATRTRARAARAAQARRSSD